MQVIMQGLNGDVVVLTRNSKRMGTDGPCKSRYARTKQGLGTFNGKLQTDGCNTSLYTAGNWEQRNDGETDSSTHSDKRTGIMDRHTNKPGIQHREAICITDDRVI